MLRWRKLSGLTAQMVAERAGVTRNTLRAINFEYIPGYLAESGAYALFR